MRRREFLDLVARAAPAGLLLPATAGTYAVAVEPAWIEVRRQTIPVRELPAALDGLRIVQLSDIHRSRSVTGRYVNEAVALALTLKPELIALTGDFITADADAFKDLAVELRPLGAAGPAFAVPGNHDYVQYYRWARPRLPDGCAQLGEALASAGIELMRNQRRLVSLRGGAGSVEVVGLDDFWSPHFDPARAFAGASPLERPRVVLCHNPDAFRALATEDFDLLLAGHTHGGQVRLPLFGPPVVPVEDRRFIAGLVAAAGRLVYVNRGLGYSRRIRLGVRPEISLLELRRA